MQQCKRTCLQFNGRQSRKKKCLFIFAFNIIKLLIRVILPLFLCKTTDCCYCCVKIALLNCYKWHLFQFYYDIVEYLKLLKSCYKYYSKIINNNFKGFLTFNLDLWTLVNFWFISAWFWKITSIESNSIML